MTDPPIAPRSPESGEPGPGAAPGSGLVFALALDAAGSGREISWPEADAINRDQQPRGDEGDAVWLHLDWNAAETHDWLRHGSGIEEAAVEALLAEETRPRSTRFDNGSVVILRGVNYNLGDDPEDMVSLRIWIEPGRLVSLRVRRVMTAQELRQNLLDGSGPATPAELLQRCAERLSARIRDLLKETDDELDSVEDRLLGGGATAQDRQRLQALRRRLIWLRRFMGPQVDALKALAGEPPAGWNDRLGDRLDETIQAAARDLEALNTLRDQGALLHEQIVAAAAEHTERSTYLFTIVATLFLPLNLIVGLLGANVAGIPGADAPLAFILVCVGLVVLMGLEFVVLRWLKQI